MELHRRSFLIAAAAAAGCGRKLASRYFGYLFVASGVERSVAIADVSRFQRIGSISVPHAPAELLLNGPKLFVTCPDGRAVYEIDRQQHKLSTRYDLPGHLIAAATPQNRPNWIVAAIDQPAALLILDTETRRVKTRVPLPARPLALDVTQSAGAVALSDGSIARISFETGRMAGATACGGRCSTMRFRQDGQALLAGLPDSREIVTLDAATGSILARLPLPIVPARFCFNEDGGQMFVTGGAGDSISIVDAYQSQVDQTIIAGRTPDGMAVAGGGRNLLLVSNPASGDVTILDIETRRLAASIHAGGTPGDLLLTPDGQYALAIGRTSGDVAVIRLNTVLDRKIKTKPLFTVFPTAPAPVSALIVPSEA